MMLAPDAMGFRDLGRLITKPHRVPSVSTRADSDNPHHLHPIVADITFAGKNR